MMKLHATRNEDPQQEDLLITLLPQLFLRHHNNTSAQQANEQK